jgi:hypothetical protein
VPVYLDKNARAYKLFVNSLRSEHTKKAYLKGLTDFMEYAKIPTLPAFLKAKPRVLQNNLIDFVISERKNQSYASVSCKLAGIVKFCAQADIMGINFKKIQSFLGEHVKTVKDRTYTHEEIAKHILRELFKGADIEYPDWLDETIIADAFTISDLQEQRRHAISAFFLTLFNQAWTSNRRTFEQENPSMTVDPDFGVKVDWLLQHHLVPNFVLHHEKGVCITHGIVKALEYGRIDRISHKRLADICGFDYGHIKLTGKTTKVVYASMSTFLPFIAPISEPDEDDSNMGNKQSSDEHPKDGGALKDELKTCHICNKFKNVYPEETERHIIFTHGKSDVELMRSMDEKVTDEHLPEQMVIAWPDRYSPELATRIVRTYPAQVGSQPSSDINNPN